MRQTRENVLSDICAQRRFKSACASAHSVQSLRCPHEESLHPWLSKKHPENNLIRLRKYTGLSESLRGTNVRKNVFCPCGLYKPFLFVCVQVLWFSKPNGVMSSAVSLPNHTFTGQAESSKRLTSIVHILSPESDKCPPSINGRERMNIEINA